MDTSTSNNFPSVNAERQDALAFAYQYGFPLYAYGRFTKAHIDTPNNAFYHQRDLIKADFTKVVRPNNDTLYSFIFYDLSQSDLCFHVPEIVDRYWAFSYYDMYANNFANVGSQTFDKPGKYLLSYDPENLQYGVRKDGANSEYLGTINSPTPYGIFLARLVVFDDEDKKMVNGFQDAMKVITAKRSSGALAPVFDRNIFVEVAQSTDGPVSEAEQVLRLTAALAQINPSEVVQDRSWIATTLEKAGIKNGKFNQPPGTSLEDAVAAANKSVQATVLSAGMMKPLGNGWTFSSSLISGDFHSFYSARHLVAMRGYLQPTADQSIYPSWYPKSQSPDGIGSACHIGPKQAILFSFSGKPRTNHSGFWSLTIYNSAQLLVANQLDRYSLGDRSNLDYPDGTSLRDRADGKFEILVQPDDVVPPAKYINNWLPAPAGGGLISFNLRVFAPAVEMVDGTYQYPEVTVIDAITPERRMSTRL